MNNVRKYADDELEVFKNAEAEHDVRGDVKGELEISKSKIVYQRAEAYDVVQEKHRLTGDGNTGHDRRQERDAVRELHLSRIRPEMSELKGFTCDFNDKRI